MDQNGRSDGYWPAARWRPGWLLFLNAAGVLLLLSMAWAPTLSLWKSLDQAVFLALNGTLPDAPGWAFFWAILNYRPVDLLAGVLMLLALVLSGLVFPSRQLRRGFLGFISLLLLGIIWRQFVHEGSELLQIAGPSPSLWVEPAWRLSEQFPNIALKDASAESFPGDHATVALIWAGYVLLFAGWRRSLLALLFAVMLILPRLFAGGHALSDVLAGSMATVLMTFGWALATPYLVRSSAWLEQRLDPLTDWLGRHIPLLDRFAYFRGSC